MPPSYILLTILFRRWTWQQQSSLRREAGARGKLKANFKNFTLSVDWNQFFKPSWGWVCPGNLLGGWTACLNWYFNLGSTNGNIWFCYEYALINTVSVVNLWIYQPQCRTKDAKPTNNVALLTPILNQSLCILRRRCKKNKKKGNMF